MSVLQIRAFFEIFMTTNRIYPVLVNKQKKEGKSMKKKSVRMVALAMIVAMMATCFAGCKKTCDMCGEKGKCTTINVFGVEMDVCEDCRGLD